MRRRVIAILVIVLIAGGGAWWWFSRNGNENGALVLYGNVALRQVDLAFLDSGRIAEVLVDEGTVVKAGDVVAKLDTSRIAPQVAQAQAQVAAQEAAVEKLHNGSRPEEIAQAKANVAAAQASADNARLTYKRLTTLLESPGASPVTESQVDAARAAMESADAQLTVAKEALALAEALTSLRPDVKLHFIGARRGIEARILPERGLPHTLLPVRGIPRGESLMKRLAVLPGLTDQNEADRPAPWSVSDAPEKFVQAQMRGIVGLKLEISRLEGKQKFSQNKPEADRAGVAKGLSEETDLSAREMAGLIPR